MTDSQNAPARTSPVTLHVPDTITIDCWVAYQQAKLEYINKMEAAQVIGIEGIARYQGACAVITAGFVPITGDDPAAVAKLKEIARTRPLSGIDITVVGLLSRDVGVPIEVSINGPLVL